jgi:hypothetical protein
MTFGHIHTNYCIVMIKKIQTTTRYIKIAVKCKLQNLCFSAIFFKN